MNTRTPDPEEVLNAMLKEARQRYNAANDTKAKMHELAEIIRLEETLAHMGQ